MNAHSMETPRVGSRPGIRAQVDSTSDSGLRLLRLRDVLKIIPVSKSAWFAGIKTGRYPKGRPLSPGVTVWRSDEIERLVLAI
jgi:prophage regulatory protein